VAVGTCHFKLAARTRAELVVAAPARRFIEPSARRAVERAVGNTPLLVVGEELGHEIRAVQFKSMPSVFAVSVENPVKWWLRDHQTTGAAVIA
jgi:hypothetical protein